MPLQEKSHLMTGSEINRTLVHLAHEIVDKTQDLASVALIGIRRRGVPIAERLAKKIGQISPHLPPVGTLDIEFYRDDLSTVGSKPLVRPSQLAFSVTGKDVILVDDVLYTGRTTRAALDALFDHGRPRRVRLCVLIDRGHRELPIEASFVGKRVVTDYRESIEVKLRETDEVEKVLLLEQTSDEPKARRKSKEATHRSE
jgi:pyrimidine operon attenuation protein/uracil phosphoribosyltransferase